MSILDWLLGRKPGDMERATFANSRGYSYHIGLNAVDPAKYAGWDGKLHGCENDAIDLNACFSSRGYETKLELTKCCTASHVLDVLEYHAAICMPGDIFVFTNSSHGGQVPDYNGDEADGMDETICMYDRELLDDELKNCWSKFRPGVRIFVISDSCHSGTVMRFMPSVVRSNGQQVRAQPTLVKDQLLSDPSYVHRYQDIQQRVAKRSAIKAYLLGFGGCQDNQYSTDGPHNGAFTGALLQHMRGSHRNENFGRLITRVRRSLPSTQTPSYRYGGPRCEAWEKAPAFAVRF